MALAIDADPLAAGALVAVMAALAIVYLATRIARRRRR